MLDQRGDEADRRRQLVVVQTVVLRRSRRVSGRSSRVRERERERDHRTRRSFRSLDGLFDMVAGPGDKEVNNSCAMGPLRRSGRVRKSSTPGCLDAAAAPALSQSVGWIYW